MVEERFLIAQGMRLDVLISFSENRGTTDVEARELIAIIKLWERHNLTEERLAQAEELFLPTT